MSRPIRPLHLLHVFPTFGPGGAEIRVTKIMNALGHEAVHTILALSPDWRARDYIQPQIKTTFLPPPPGRGSLLYFLELRKVLWAEKPDLLLTYNWGAIQSVMAGRLATCPIVHNECGFGVDEAISLKLRRI